jgi:antitoxin (DNA-binding transcriptional repressor) of toxin-antitoxin stability system
MLPRKAQDNRRVRRTEIMSNVSIEEARAKLSELIHDLHPGDEVIITEGENPVARLLPPVNRREGKKRQLGTLHGTVRYIAPDFDAPLEDFKDYMG